MWKRQLSPESMQQLFHSDGPTTAKLRWPIMVWAVELALRVKIKWLFFVQKYWYLARFYWSITSIRAYQRHSVYYLKGYTRSKKLSRWRGCQSLTWLHSSVDQTAVFVHVVSMPVKHTTAVCCTTECKQIRKTSHVTKWLWTAFKLSCDTCRCIYIFYIYITNKWEPVQESMYCNSKRADCRVEIQCGTLSGLQSKTHSWVN